MADHDRPHHREVGHVHDEHVDDRQAGPGPQVVCHAVKAGIRPYAESGGRSWGIRLFGSVIFPEIFPDPPGLILIRGPPTDPVSVGALPPVMAGGSVGV